MTAGDRTGRPDAVRRGRPHHMPYDDSPGTVNVDARIGWLLRMSRLYAADLSIRRTDSFLAALAGCGRRAAASQLTRWEQGTVPAPPAVIDDYSRALGLPPSALRAFADGIRESGIGRTRWHGTVSYRPERSVLQDRLDRALDRGLDPADWFALAEDLNQFDTVFVSTTDWETITRRLLRALCRSVSDSYVVLHRSLVRLGGVDGAAPHLVRAIEDLSRDPHAQVLADPIGSLELLTDPNTDVLLLSMLHEPLSARELTAAAWATANRITSGRLTGDTLAGLPALCVDLADRAGAHLTAGADLLIALPAPLRAAAVGRLPAGRRALLDELLRNGDPAIDNTTALAAGIAEAAYAAVERHRIDGHSRMLEQLIHEGLFHAGSERRHQAWLTIELSPFRLPVAAELSTVVQRGRHRPATLARALAGLSYLAGPASRDWLLAYTGRTDVPADLRAGAVRALAHLPPRRQDQALLTTITTSADRSLREAALYALGMTAPVAVRELGADPEVSPDLRAAANWWSRLMP